MNEITELLLTAPDSQLDACTFPLIKKWDEEPKAIQILEVLDMCVNGGLASSFVMQVLDIELECAIKREHIKYEDLIPLASWRN